jgi:uncharacterized membrane protein
MAMGMNGKIMWRNAAPGRWLLAGLFVAAGAMHFIKPRLYQRIIPPEFPDPSLLVVISGICEIAGGLGLLIPRLRRPAGWALVALLIAVFPANIYMAVSPQKFPSTSVWMLWARLPLQGALIAWVYVSARLGRRSPTIAANRRAAPFAADS